MISTPGKSIITPPEQLQQVYAHCPVAVLMVDYTATIVWANQAAGTLSDQTAIGLIGVDFFRLYHDPLLAADSRNYLLSGEELRGAEFEGITANGQQIFVLVDSTIYSNTSGLRYTLLFLTDITSRKKHEHLLGYLDVAARELARVRDTKSAIDKISQLIVPHFAGWFTIDVLKDDHLEQLILVYDDPERKKWAERYREAYPIHIDSERGIAKVLRSGKPALIHRITPEMLKNVVHEHDRLEMVETMGLQSVITVPMFNKGAISGAIKFISTTPGKYYDETDLHFAQNLAHHIGLALENAQLNEEASHEITRRKQIEDKLKVTQTQLKSALSSGLVGTWILDLQTNVVYPDENLSRMFGIEHPADGCDRELLSRLIHEDDITLVDRRTEDAISAGQIYETEYRALIDGETRWFFARGTTETDSEGNPAIFTGVLVDITQRKDAQNALKESEARYSVAFQNASVGIILSTIDGKLMRANEAFTRITGYAEADLLNKDFSSITYQDDQEINAELYRKLFVGEVNDFVLEKRYYHKHGHVIWVRASTSMVRNDLDAPAYTISIIEDITAHKQAQNELKASEELFRFLTDAIQHKMWTSAPDGKATYYNKGWYDYTGVQSFHELHLKVWEFIHPDDRAVAAFMWPQAIREGKESVLEHRLRRADGQYRWHLSRFSPHKDNQGNITVWVGTSTDIHEQKGIQEALMRSEAHFKAVTHLNSLPIWQVNADCETVFVNDTWRAFTGVTSDNINESHWTDNIHPDDREEALQQFNALFAARQPVHLKYRFQHAPTGEYRWMLDNAQPVFNPAFYGYIGTMTDIHEQEQATLAIQQLMGKKDEFISVASHELKTPLTTIKVFFQLMQREMTGEHRLASLSVKADRQLQRLERLIEELLDVSRINAGKMTYQQEDFDIAEALTEAIDSVQEISPKHQLSLTDIGAMNCCGDRYRIEQVLVNLLSNAVKYSPDGGAVNITYGRVDDRVKIAVQDFGIGIAAEDMEGLFSRFYRVDQLSHRFQGLGLGLFISDEIVRRHGGQIKVESTPGEGSIFSFTLPPSL